MGKRKLLLKDSRGLSPAISTVIMTATIIVMVLVAMAYGQSYLSSSMAQNEFSTNQQFMVTTGLQIDDVAWTVGRAQTIQYSSTYGDLEVLPQALTYTIAMYQGAILKFSETISTGIIMYDVPTTEYSLGNNYMKVLSSSNSAFLQSGTAAPVSCVYSVERVPMSDGNLARVVVVPTIRNMTTAVGGANYDELYLPLLVNGTSLGLSQSATLVCQTVDQYVQSGITRLQVSLTFPLVAQGFSSAFFPFAATTVTENFPVSSTVQLYVGEVSVSIGLYG